MADVTPEQSAAIDEELPKVGKTIAKILIGIGSFLEKVAVNLSPFVADLLVRVVTGLAKSWGDSVLRKNGVDV